MYADNSTEVMGRGAVRIVERILEHFPENPVQGELGRLWVAMTTTYSAFQIATFGSLIMHEVRNLSK